MIKKNRTVIWFSHRGQEVDVPTLSPLVSLLLFPFSFFLICSLLILINQIYKNRTVIWMSNSRGQEADELLEELHRDYEGGRYVLISFFLISSQDC